MPPAPPAAPCVAVKLAVKHCGQRTSLSPALPMRPLCPCALRCALPRTLADRCSEADWVCWWMLWPSGCCGRVASPPSSSASGPWCWQ
eukprot:522609-Rhodomonas_salina.1